MFACINFKLRSMKQGFTLKIRSLYWILPFHSWHLVDSHRFDSMDMYLGTLWRALGYSGSSKSEPIPVCNFTRVFVDFFFNSPLLRSPRKCGCTKNKQRKQISMLNCWKTNLSILDLSEYQKVPPKCCGRSIFLWIS